MDVKGDIGLNTPCLMHEQKHGQPTQIQYS